MTMTTFPADLVLGTCFLLTCGVLAFVVYRVEQRTRPLRQLARSSGTEKLESLQAFIERLERLVEGSRRVGVLDRSNLTRHLAAAPGYLSGRCAPRDGYRHVSKAGAEDSLKDLVHLIRRSSVAERGTYRFVEEDSIFSKLSYCFVERDDGLFVFLVRRLGRRHTDVALVRDPDFGRFLLDEYDRLWRRLCDRGPALFDEGRLDPTEDARLFNTRPRPKLVPEKRLLVAA